MTTNSEFNLLTTNSESNPLTTSKSVVSLSQKGCRDSEKPSVNSPIFRINASSYGFIHKDSPKLMTGNNQ